MNGEPVTKGVVYEAITRLLNLFPGDEADELMRMKLRNQLSDRLEAHVSLDPPSDLHHIDGTVEDEEHHKVKFHIDL